MTQNRLSTLCAAIALSLAAVIVHPAYSAQPQGVPQAAAGKPAPGKPQSELASKTAKFGDAAPSALKGALEAHDLAGGKAKEGKSGSFTGTVTKAFAPSSNSIVILNFDKDYKTALTAVVFSENFAKFPDLKTLVGKKVLVTGAFKDYHNSTEVVLTSPTDIKIAK